MAEDIMAMALVHLETGGWVMIPLACVSGVMIFLVIKKHLDLRTFCRGDRPIAQIVKTWQNPGFTAALWQEEIMAVFLKQRSFDPKKDQRIIESLRIRQEAFLDRDTKTIALLASLAPLLGLLGTVGGMISTFAVISRFGTGNAQALASGISKALITTQTGLVVAVPGLMLAGNLHRKSEKTKKRIQRFCLGLLRNHESIGARKIMP